MWEAEASTSSMPGAPAARAHTPAQRPPAAAPHAVGQAITAIGSAQYQQVARRGAPRGRQTALRSRRGAVMGRGQSPVPQQHAMQRGGRGTRRGPYRQQEF